MVLDLALVDYGIVEEDLRQIVFGQELINSTEAS